MDDIEQRLLGQLALSDTSTIAGSAVVSIPTQRILSCRNIDNPVRAAESAVAAWRAAAGLASGSNRVVRVDTESESFTIYSVTTAGSTMKWMRFGRPRDRDVSSARRSIGLGPGRAANVSNRSNSGLYDSGTSISRQGFTTSQGNGSVVDDVSDLIFPDPDDNPFVGMNEMPDDIQEIFRMRASEPETPAYRPTVLWPPPVLTRDSEKFNQHRLLDTYASLKHDAWRFQ